MSSYTAQLNKLSNIDNTRKLNRLDQILLHMNNTKLNIDECRIKTNTAYDEFVNIYMKCISANPHISDTECYKDPKVAEAYRKYIQARHLWDIAIRNFRMKKST